MYSSLPTKFLFSIMATTLNDFIYIQHNALTPEFCKHVIDKFERDKRSAPGMVGKSEDIRVDKTIKDSLDLRISGYDDWKEEDNVFFESLSYHVEEYLKAPFLPKESQRNLIFNKPSDNGYQIQRTSPNAGYTWHHDDQHGDYVIDYGVRWLTFIWYLNDVTEDGYTEFTDGTKIQPEEGKIVLFPSSWPFYHRGYPPKSEEKYIVTGWMHAK